MFLLLYEFNFWQQYSKSKMQSNAGKLHTLNFIGPNSFESVYVQSPQLVEQKNCLSEIASKI